MSAARRPSSTARRGLLTATAAGTLLAALWFVPSANATQDDPVQQSTSGTVTSQDAQPADPSGSTGSADSMGSADSTGANATGVATAHTRLADTGSFDSTPYIVGGTLFLSLGAGFVAYSVRRERTALS
ncbi:hypothetical protein [Streptomyces poonensis]|uniref:LPXTG cell wall anchor domain-containing protein n=1 Tax=Streptomyces poonensis TaxID=68255 RepID=A0A918P993_9ACTN|nr:hypothetical protein [Streptomyces poonensis]GGY91407.1 hypothetical protein GCM10010365_07270 [Streptomyces poonensis]GLJ87836.1 hypothetical protein GCM10017589_04360 [Streptomyces poonensis]